MISVNSRTWIIFVRQDSDSGSEGSDSSQSESESDDDGNEQQEVQRLQPPPLSHYHPANQMLSPGQLQHTFNNNPTTPTQKKKFEERVCKIINICNPLCNWCMTFNLQTAD